MQRFIPFLVLIVPILGCSSEVGSETSSNQTNRAQTEPIDTDDFAIGGATAKQEAEIRSLVEHLVYSDGEASNRPIRNPGMKIFDADGNEVKPSDDSIGAEEDRKRFESCQIAFQRLYEMKGLAIPILLEHLDDKRQSINFRNHHLGNSVGNACYWNIYYQLVDQPEDYSEYGYRRRGRDGEQHPKPYWEGTPFDEAGGLKEWITQHEGLNYKELQVKCLEWLLEEEKAIGASDPESYFLNILPLEIRILERRLENGEAVEVELARFRRIRDEKLADQIPINLLPDR